ncbi:hypothetical protein B0H11DRAFT_1909841 [Mycena galericulata]|nr:hypothetical protein B0H11DRAFT_1909841 [Mycena galericulata]
MYIRHPRRHFSLAYVTEDRSASSHASGFNIEGEGNYSPRRSQKGNTVPHSTYGMVGGLDKQIKEVIKPPVRHLELLDALGIAQCKGALPVPPRGAHYTDRKSIRAGG